MASRASEPPSIHSPIFFSAATPVTSFSSYCENECLSPPRAPSGPSPVMPSSSALLSSTASYVLCLGASGYARGHADLAPSTPAAAATAPLALR